MGPKFEQKFMGKFGFIRISGTYSSNSCKKIMKNINCSQSYKTLSDGHFEKKNNIEVDM